MPDNDAIAVREAGDAVATIEMRYRMADINGKAALRDAKQAAWDAYLEAKEKLIADGDLCSDNDLVDMIRIRSEIQTAADQQALLSSAVKLAGILRKFIV